MGRAASPYVFALLCTWIVYVLIMVCACIEGCAVHAWVSLAPPSGPLSLVRSDCFSLLGLTPLNRIHFYIAVHFLEMFLLLVYFNFLLLIFGYGLKFWQCIETGCLRQ